MHIVLYEPEIPQNTGNIIRLCANVGLELDLVEPLGFSLQDKYLRRAGLDYHDSAVIHRHPTFADYLTSRSSSRVIAFSTKADLCYHKFSFDVSDSLVFGPESRGLPTSIFNQCDAVLRLPMRPNSRSINLSNAVSIAVFEALRQQGFKGLL